MIVYESYTWNCKTLALRIDSNAESIYKLKIDEPVLLITPTLHHGSIARNTNYFLKEFAHLVKGIVVAGEESYGKDAWRAADTILKRYPHIELVRKIEKQGTEEDYKYIKDWYEKNIKK